MITFCLHNSGQGKENRIWFSFIWNFSPILSSGDLPENSGMAETPSLRKFWKALERRSVGLLRSKTQSGRYFM